MKNALSVYYWRAADVFEIYSQPRVAQAAAEYNKEGITLQPVWSLDLTRADPSTGKAWDSSKPQVQSRVNKLVWEMRPLFLIGSPPCTVFFVIAESLTCQEIFLHCESRARRRQGPLDFLHEPLQDPDQGWQVSCPRTSTQRSVADGGVPGANRRKGRG